MQHARPPTWVPDDTAPRCQGTCGTAFDTMERRHHCRACGQLVCADCSRSRVSVPGSDNLKRACDLCAAARRDLPACEPTDGRVYRGGGGGETLGDEPRRSASEASDVDTDQARLRELL